MFLALWEFEVKSGCETRFLSVYGPQGEWVELFRADANFVETRLLRDPVQPGKFVTLDFWQSRNAYEHFREQNHAAHSAIDKRCETLTSFEKCLGYFEN